MDFAENYHRWILDEICAYLGRSVAEVGAGIGSISRLLLGEPIEHLTAFEPSPDLFAHLASNVASDERATAVNDYFTSSHDAAPFDSVVYLNVLEHIEDDRGELTKAFDSLAHGGRLIVFVPALQWLYSNFDREVGHFRRYTRKNLEQIVIDSGFTVLESRYFDVAGIIPWFLNFVVLRRSLGGGSVAAYDRLVVPLMQIVEGIVAPPLGKNVLLVARKP